MCTVRECASRLARPKVACTDHGDGAYWEVWRHSADFAPSSDGFRGSHMAVSAVSEAGRPCRGIVFLPAHVFWPGAAGFTGKLNGSRHGKD